MADERPFDKALFLHEQQAARAEAAQEERALLLSMSMSDAADADEAKEDEAAKRQHKSALRASQGDRTKWSQHLEPIPGTRTVPDHRLPFRIKQGRTQSLKAAAERRTRRRDEKGITVHFDHQGWNRLSEAKREAFEARKRGIVWEVAKAIPTMARLDFNRDFHWYSGRSDAPDHLDHLLRFGTAKPGRPQSHRQHSRESGQRPEGWYAG